MTVFSKISIIITAICFAVCVVLGLFCLVRAIVLNIKAKKEMKQALKEHEDSKNRIYGNDSGRKKSK